MDFTTQTPRLTHHGALTTLHAAMDKALELKEPVNIVVVDEGGNIVASVRMDGAKFLSMKTATAKAVSAASHRRATTEIDSDYAASLASASQGWITNMAGGLPIVVGGVCVGGIGVGSAPDADDVAIARAGLAAIGAEERMPPERKETEVR
jgi:glc operon protein GlcG